MHGESRGRSRFPLRFQSTAGCVDVKPGSSVADRAFWLNVGTLLKKGLKSVTCKICPNAFACYLCNTHPKTRCSRPFKGVPLLLVQGRSLSCPCDGGGHPDVVPCTRLCRLSPSRSAGVSKGAMRLRHGFAGTKGPSLGCVAPSGFRNLP